MATEVLIYSSDESERLGVGTLQRPYGRSGEYYALLRPPAGLPPDDYLLRLPDGQRWMVKTLSAPDQRLGMYGGRVTALSNQRPPV
jgi:hypothetical protein